jgi:hypothetical protein
MPKNTLTDLRNHLFATLEALADREKPLEIERAKAICSTAQTIIESARIEVKYMEVTGQGEKHAEKFFGTEELPVTFSGDKRGRLSS